MQRSQSAPPSLDSNRIPNEWILTQEEVDQLLVAAVPTEPYLEKDKRRYYPMNVELNQWPAFPAGCKWVACGLNVNGSDCGHCRNRYVGVFVCVIHSNSAQQKDFSQLSILSLLFPALPTTKDGAPRAGTNT